MSDIPPPQSMIPPGSSPSYPELRYNNAGNAYARNEDDVWVPHPGICKVSFIFLIYAFRRSCYYYSLSPPNWVLVIRYVNGTTLCIFARLTVLYTASWHLCAHSGQVPVQFGHCVTLTTIRFPCTSPPGAN
jgi:hypothetical protein